MCSSAPPADPLIGQAAVGNMQLSKDALDYYKAKDAANQPRQDKLDALTEQLANQQIDSSAFTTQQAKDQYNRYNDTFVPLENQVVSEAENYDSEAKQAQAAGQAGTDVQVATAQARDASGRSMARMGVNPASGRYQSTQDSLASQEALQEAGARNNAREGVKQYGIALRKDAANFGRNMTGTAAQTIGAATAAGAGATGAVQGSIAAANQSAATLGTGYNTAINGNSTAGSILNGQYAAQIGATNAGNNQTAALAGTAATIGIAI